MTRRTNTKAAATAAAPPKDVYATMYGRLIEQLAAGTVPWVRPWKEGAAGGFTVGMPVNAATRRGYSGGNVLALFAAQLEAGYATAGWLTFRQAVAAGAVVQKGQKATPVSYFKTLTRKDASAPPDAKEKTARLARLFFVFNVDQLADLPEHEGAVERLRARVTTPFVDDAGDVVPPLEAAERVVAATGARIVTGPRAAYTPALDTVMMPARRSFAESEAYYATLWHELAHWTGAAHRLDRLKLSAGFGSELYAFEELVAELAACFLSARFGFEHVSQSAAYLANWIRCLTKHDAAHGDETPTGPRALARASSLAMAAAEFVYPTARTAEDDAADDDTSEEATDAAA